ncbi:Fur family transcriptional regulator [Acinetobacter stercoris]|uniref:Zinc uptake regulation protein n=1 Tax=Acinetobacter stercoris TaxID=2126983 RepID=A0A2U3N378_9GAMM|nr:MULTISPECIES: Fur family transcriptional regulator [Acinetobacter]SPL72128.1 Zinc uptake regulation protein [Acinetobacter stercoris]
MKTEKKLSKAQQHILDILKNENRPLSAYELLSLAKIYGIRAPMQIYRGLNQLMQYGLILKLTSLNMYLAHQFKDEYLLFSICSDCKKVQYTALKQLPQAFHQFIVTNQFNPTSYHLEILGRCAGCVDTTAHVSNTNLS